MKPSENDCLNVLRFCLVAGISVAALTTAAYAQTAPAPQNQPPCAPGDQSARCQTASDQEQVIVVTGSRIPRPNLEQPTPVSTVPQEMIQNAGTSNLGDIIAQLPALSFSGTVRANGNSFGDAGGLNFPNLRDLGTSRTLTLVDGRRHVAGDAGDSAVDLNSIPPALVDHVEVTTGGASAIYGSDAVSGVINIITKHNFQGFSGDIQYGTPTNGSYGANSSIALTFGHEIARERGNFTVSVFYDHTNPVTANQIPSLDNYGTIINPLDGGPGDGIPDRLLVRNVVSELIDENSVIIDGFSGAPISGLTASGVPVAQPTRTGDNSFAFGSFAAPCATCFQLEDWVLLVPRTNRGGVAASFDYDLTPHTHFHFDGKFVETHIFDYVQPAFSFFEDEFIGLNPGTEIQADNPYMTPAIRAVYDAAIAAGELPETARFLGDVGARTNDITRRTWRGVVDLNGDLETGMADFRWDLSYVDGQTSNDFVGGGERIPGNYFAAIDAVLDPVTNTIKCRVDVPSAQPIGYTPPAGMTDEPCVPYNVFGQQNTPAALDYVSTTTHRTHSITQKVWDANLSFDTSNFLNLPGGPVGVALGAEYRDETSANRNDPFVQSGLTDQAPQPDAFGGFHVSEAFIEANLPILKNAPFADELSLDLAYRAANYHPFGNADAWKVGFVYGPLHQIRFRGTYGQAVRAPNITEAFLPPTSTFFSIVDPCDVTNVNNNPNRPGNCAALGVPAGFNSNTNVSVPGTASGNPDLSPESSKSWTAGVVLQPDWVHGLAVTLDYYNIDITNAINFVAAQDILNNCVDAPGGPDLSFCNLFTRGSDNNINFISSQFVNASELLTSGWDLNITYTTGVEGLTSHVPGMHGLNGDLSVTMNANYLERLRLAPFQDHPEQQDILEATIGDPRVKLLSRIQYEQGPLTIGWDSRFLSKVVRYNRNRNTDRGESISPNTIEPNWYHDLNARYRLGGDDGHFEIFGGVNNIFNEAPPLGVVQGDGSDASYDLLGRFMFAGVRARF